MSRCIMIQGTMSGVGKSLLTAALCRIFYQDGFRVAPFKSQNMALNSFITEDGKEMGRAQVLQAQAAGKKPDARMNPILLKPSSDVGSQVILHGEVKGNFRAAEYFRMKRSLIPDILADYDSLAEENDIIVIEGAGSPAEINLKKDDIVNMGLAKLVNAPVILVGDIDPGGVFAQLYGTLLLLEESEKERVIGTIINKFRGDEEILWPGLAMLEKLTGVPVLGVVPYLSVDLDDEDSLSPRLEKAEQVRAIDVAVIRFPHISNFTDFIPLELHPDLGIRYVGKTGDLGHPDIVVLPGTKNTIRDLLWMRENGLEAAILRLHESGTPIFGICGGYQMLGETLSDPEGAEAGHGEAAAGCGGGSPAFTRSGPISGMRLLPVETVFSPKKTQTQTEAEACTFPFTGNHISGYQIHMGLSTIKKTAGAEPFCRLPDGTEEGLAYNNVFGTYLHGLFDTGELTGSLAAWLLRRKGIEGTEKNEEHAVENYHLYQEKQLDLLADTVRRHLDMQAVYRAMGL